MRLIKPSVEILEQQPGLDGIYKQIELAGRTCYKSENRITKDSAKKFVDAMVKSGHGAMLEHGTVYLYYTYPRKAWHQENDLATRYFRNPYSKVVQCFDKREDIYEFYITTNYRVLVENGWVDDLRFLCAPTSHIRRYTVRFICDRGVSHELVRHKLCVA